MSVTIKDIAREAGVSYSTVSRAINGLDLVNEITREHVLRTAKRLGYMPNTSAVNLKRNRTFMLGVYFSTISKMSSPEVLHEVVTAIYEVVKENYMLVVKGVDNHSKGSLNPAVFDGIVNITQRDSDEEFIQEAVDKKIPIVVVNRKSKISVDTVLTDETDAFYRSMKFLLDHGHRRIVALEGPAGLDSTRRRHAGWVKAAREAGIDPDTIPVYEGNYRYDSGVSAAEKILAHKPTALLSFNDEMAFGVERVMIQKGLRVPEDMSVIGFDNWNHLMYSSMNLTTVERSMYELSKEACRLLLQRIEAGGGNRGTRTIFMDAPLIERGSVAFIGTPPKKENGKSR